MNKLSTTTPPFFRFAPTNRLFPRWIVLPVTAVALACLWKGFSWRQGLPRLLNGHAMSDYATAVHKNPAYLKSIYPIKRTEGVAFTIFGFEVHIIDGGYNFAHEIAEARTEHERATVKLRGVLEFPKGASANLDEMIEIAKKANERMRAFDKYFEYLKQITIYTPQPCPEQILVSVGIQEDKIELWEDGAFHFVKADKVYAGTLKFLDAGRLYLRNADSTWSIEIATPLDLYNHLENLFVA